MMDLPKATDAEKHLECEGTNRHASLGLTADESYFYENFPPSARARLLRKVDLHLVPTLAVLYLAAHIDRANIGNAKIEGLTADLNMSGVQYNIALSLFFVPYILLEVPSNVILKMFRRPSTYMAILVVSWGLIMTFTGFVRNFTGLLVCRVLLGVAEAGFFPGAIYLITQWYSPKELQTRIAIFYTASALSGAFSGLLAFAIARMDGLGGRPGWAWIFILEGIFTVLLGVLTLFAMPDSPSLSGRWLSADEIRYLELQNMIREGGRAAHEMDRFRWKDLWELVTDYKLYLQVWILFTSATCLYGLKFVMPSITKSMGYTSSQAQLLTIPPYVAGALSAFGFAWLSDRKEWRAPFVIIPALIIVLGCAIILPLAPDITEYIAPCYVGVVLICIGQYPTTPGGTAWLAGNLTGTKKAMGLAIDIALGNLGGVSGSYLFFESEAPGYRTGFSVSIAIAATCVASSMWLEYSYWRINKKREALDEDMIRQQYSPEELAWMGDKSPLFKHQL